MRKPAADGLEGARRCVELLIAPYPIIEEDIESDEMNTPRQLFLLTIIYMIIKKFYE
jgi:hypothetical protein